MVSRQQPRESGHSSKPTRLSSDLSPRWEAFESGNESSSSGLSETSHMDLQIKLIRGTVDRIKSENGKSWIAGLGNFLGGDSGDREDSVDLNQLARETLVREKKQRHHKRESRR